MVRTIAALLLATSTSCRIPAPDVDPRIGPAAGSTEFTVGGAGIGNSRFNGVEVALSGSVGYYLADQWLLVGRQSASYDDEGEDRSTGSTRIGVDWIAAPERTLRPFIGLNLGFTFGESINETLAIAPEFGLRYFVKPSTFVQAMAEAQVFVTTTEDRTEVFDDGAILYSVSLGVTF